MTKHLTTMAAALSLLVACSLDSAASGDHPLAGAGTSSSGASANGGGGASGSAMTAGSAGSGVSGANAGGAGSAGASGSSAGGAGSAGTSAGGSSGSAGGAAGSRAGSGGSAAGSGPPPSNDAGVMPGDGAVRAIAAPPTYQGNGSGGCTTTRQTTGFEPDDAGGAHPLFLYFVGTRFVDSDTSARYDSQAAAKISEAMARRGFVALSVDYDNSLSLSADKLSCVFSSSSATSLLKVACALPNVDCDLGIATWGHSQGALMAHASSNFDPRVRAVWTTGYSGGDYPLPDTRLRVVNGEGDSMNGTWSTLNKAAGMSAAECPDDGRSSCLRADGSGWILVRESDCVSSSADHCWFDRTSCVASAITLEPNWIDPASTKAFALDANADWLAATVARP